MTTCCKPHHTHLHSLWVNGCFEELCSLEHKLTFIHSTFLFLPVLSFTKPYAILHYSTFSLLCIGQHVSACLRTALTSLSSHDGKFTCTNNNKKGSALMEKGETNQTLLEKRKSGLFEENHSPNGQPYHH